MKNCILYKYIAKNFLNQIILTFVMICSSIILLLFTVTDLSFSKENLGCGIFALSIISFALMIFISSVKGRRDNIIKLNTLINKKEFDEVIIESTNVENPDFEIKLGETPHLLFFKEKGKIVFQMLLLKKDLNGIYIFLKNLNCNSNIRLPLDKKANSGKSNYLDSFIPDVA